MYGHRLAVLQDQSRIGLQPHRTAILGDDFHLRGRWRFSSELSLEKFGCVLVICGGRELRNPQVRQFLQCVPCHAFARLVEGCDLPRRVEGVRVDDVVGILEQIAVSLFALSQAFPLPEALQGEAKGDANAAQELTIPQVWAPPAAHEGEDADGLPKG